MWIEGLTARQACSLRYHMIKMKTENHRDVQQWLGTRKKKINTQVGHQILRIKCSRSNILIFLESGIFLKIISNPDSGS